MTHAEELIAIEQIDKGLLLPVRAHPGAKQNGVTGIHNQCLKVSVTTAPEKGKANNAFVKVLAKQLNVKRSQISLHRGSTSQHKQFLITGVTIEELQQAVANTLR